MKLYELLQVLNFKTMVAIQNVDNKRQPHPKYQKLENISMIKVRNILNYDIMQITTTDTGLWIKVHDRERLKQDLNAWDIVDKWYLRKDQRENRR